MNQECSALVKLFYTGKCTFLKIYLYEYKPGYDILYFIYCDAMHNERTLMNFVHV